MILADCEFYKNCPEQVYQKTVNSKELLLAGGNLNPARVMQLSGDTTVEHMEKNGLVENCLKPRHLLWMIGWSTLEIKQQPRPSESLIIRTWAGTRKNGMYPRHFGLYTSKGQVIASACTLWLSVDEKTRKMSEEEDALKDMKTISMADEIKRPKLLMNFPEEYPFETEHIVMDQEIDRNGHCNNIWYLVWGLDLLSEEYLSAHGCKGLWVQYSKELLKGQKVIMKYLLQKDILYVQGSCEGEACFSLKIEFNEKEV